MMELQDVAERRELWAGLIRKTTETRSARSAGERRKTEPLKDERGQLIGLVERETGLLFTRAGNFSDPLTKAHRCRRQAATRMGVERGVECQRFELAVELREEMIGA